MATQKNKKGLLVYCLLFVAMLSVIFCGLSTLVLADEITIVADVWEPYNGEPGSPAPGYGIEIAVQVFEKAGHTVKYTIVPWSRAVLRTRKGNHNAIIGAYKEDAPDFIFPDEEFGISQLALYGKKGCTFEYKGTKSLIGKELGVIKGYSYGEEIDKFMIHNKKNIQFIHGEDALTRIIKMLIAGRIELAIEDANVMNRMLVKIGLPDQVVRLKSKSNYKANRVYIAFSPNIAKSKEYAETFTRGIRTLKKSGVLDKILKKYGLKYWK